MSEPDRIRVTRMNPATVAAPIAGRYVPADPPASTAVQVRALVMPEAPIEVDVVAVVARA